MSDVDVVILAILCVAALVGAIRGLLREAVGLVVWLSAVLIPLLYTARFARMLPIEQVGNESTRAVISAVVLFAGTLFIGSLINWTVGRARARKKLAGPERVMGAVFGIARSGVVLTLLVLCANMAPELRQEAWWQSSRAMPALQDAAQFIHARLPDGTWQHFDFPLTGS